MKIFLKTIVFVCVLVGSSFGLTDPASCTEIKHLDFFGIRDIEVSWPESETRPFEGTDFLIPVIVKQLAAYRSGCSPSKDESRFDKLISLYLRIRRIGPGKLPSAPIDNNLRSSQKISTLRWKITDCFLYVRRI